MANIEHSSITDPNIHEPKGISSASANEVYVADGASSGDWTPLQDVYTVFISDVSTAETIYVPIIADGTVTKVVTVLGGAITVADATIDVKNSSGSSMGTITVAFTSSGAGDIDTLEPASNNTVTEESFITVETDGGSTDAQTLGVSVVVERT